MALWRNFKTFYLKEDYDWDRSDITFYNFHPQLKIVLMIEGIFFNNRNSPIRFVLPTLNGLISMVAIGFETFYVYNAVMTEDYTFASECFCYLVIIATVPIVYASVLYNRDKITQLLDNMNGHFIQVCKLGARYRDNYMDGQLLIWKLCVAWLTFIFVVSVLFITNTGCLLLYQSLFATQDEHKVRPLIFPMWLPEDDPYRSPNYEIFLGLQILLITVVVQTFAVYVYTEFHFLLHSYIIMEMIILDLEVVFEGMDEKVVELAREDPRRAHAQGILKARMKRITTWHNDVIGSVNKVSSVFGPPLAYQVMFSAAALCVMAYQVVDKLENGKIDFLFALLWCAGCIQLWIPCYLGTLIRMKGFDIGDACWNCGWETTSLGRLVRLDLLIIIARAQRPLTITLTGLPQLTLETFSSVMSTSYTYFNMLRQTGK